MPAQEDSGQILSKQKIILILSIFCLVFSHCILSRNVARYIPKRTNVFIGILLFAFSIIIIWVIAFCGAVYEKYGLIYFCWAMWCLLGLFWMLFIVGCITPTRCSEGLWLIENKDRVEYQIELDIDFYYHNYHEPLPDRLPKNLDNEHGHRNYEDIPYVIDYDPMIEFVKYNIPWKSSTGAFIYLSNYLLVVVFFTWTAHILYSYAGLLYANAIKKNSQRAKCSC